jgi:hypothetical protein
LKLKNSSLVELAPSMRLETFYNPRPLTGGKKLREKQKKNGMRLSLRTITNW